MLDRLVDEVAGESRPPVSECDRRRASRRRAVDGRRSRATSARRARWLVEAGFDVVDINFGCPVKKVLGRCRGGYLLSQVEPRWRSSPASRAVPPIFR